MKRRFRMALVSCFFAIICVGASATGRAADGDYPNRTIKIVVPAPPGPLLDVIPRIIG
jgi:tripartite-type tricarboxylate transporter receptor subunit TctC